MKTPSSLEICACAHCSGKIEYESDRRGETVTCPHCSHPTPLGIIKSPPGPKPAPSEIVFLQENNILITNHRVKIESQTFALRNITSVAPGKSQGRYYWPLALLVFIALSVLPDFLNGQGRITPFAALLTAGAVAWLIHALRWTYSLRLSTSAGEVTVMTARKPDEIVRCVDAINEAIIAQ